MNNKFYTSRYDRLFKKIFFKEEDHDLLEELIKEITNLVIFVEKIVNCELPITDIFEKEKRVDGIIDTTKERIHIEINSDTKDYYRMRNFLYFVAIMLEDIKRGKNYNPKKKYIHISLDFSDKNKNHYLIFGKESTGIPKEILHNNLDRCYRIPTSDNIRALNLSNCVALVTYEALRQQKFPNLLRSDPFKGEDYLEKE